MTRYLLASAFALATVTGGALAQGVAPNPGANFPNGPAGSESVTKTQRTINPDGTVIDKTKNYDKTQTYSGGDGELSAHSTIKKREETTVTPPATTTTTSTRTTTEDVSH
jgi:hypothetical protein